MSDGRVKVTLSGPGIDRSLVERPIDGHVMVPAIDSDKYRAWLICGHDYVQAWSEDKQAEFEMFIREVLRTTR